MAKTAVWILAGLLALGGCGDDDGGDVAVDTPGVDLGSPRDLGPAPDFGPDGPPDLGPAPDFGPDGPPDLGPGVDATTPRPDLGPPGGGCGADPGSADQNLSVDHDGRTRTFAVHLPDGYDRSTPSPVVLNFHGRGSTATQQQALSGMNAEADDEGFIAVHPQGVGNTWNAGFCCGEAMSSDIDDVGFVDAMLDELEVRFCVDTNRVFATGLSNGGFISHRIACELSGRIAAIAPVAGTNVTSPCSPSQPVSVIHFHGTADTLVPYDGFTGGFASVDSTMSGWASRNGCGSGSSTYFTSGDVTCEEWTGCDGGTSVRLCTVDGGGHQWPGGFTIPGLGSNTSDISATSAGWDFFADSGR